ncbi:hypothetical protein FSP39_022698 [Pinctada imbricata]|uniref:Calcium-activated chloride channel N-terminal domain-containing protein n=1 Tax=Pinctada imbricata TaxID=66713 RepID=A0AA88XUV2_PINIB|nr:hypothetical protein FSP39_022698 [Pinctada imbricata]
MSECGAEGQYVHITPFSLVKYPNLAKALVHQWGHLRWGLFDEYSETESPTFRHEKSFYSSEGTFKPNTCSNRIKGRFSKQCYVGNEKCLLRNGVPASDCKFCPSAPSDTTTSIMGYYYLNGISQFCDKASSSVDAAEHHNTKADTLQNRLCDGRSAWEVMRLHPDFNNLAAGSPSMVTVPTFNIVQQGNQKVVIVMDISGSMSMPYQRLQLEEPSIGAGLREGIKCLTDASASTRGSILLLISDGDEQDYPRISTVRQEVVDSGVVVMSLAFTDQSDIQMVDLATSTGGRSFLYSGLSTSTALLDAFWQSTTVVGDRKHSQNLIQSGAITVSSSNPYSGSFIIDSHVGEDTTIVLSGDRLSFLTITITSPSTYRSDQCDVTSCRLRIPGIAKTGNYTFTVTSTSNSDSNIIYSIQSKQREDNSKGIVTISWTSGGVVDMSKHNLVKMFTSVMRSGAPILGANVTAVFDGSSRQLQLFDNGCGADALENDGIYSAHILPKYLTGNGRTSAKVIVLNKDGSATLIVPLGRRKRSTESLENIKLTTIKADLFERTILSEEVTVINYDASNTNDILAPSKITTLEIISSNSIYRRFGLRFKAVGDDLDDGRATAYDVRMSHDFDKLLEDVNNTHRVMDNITTPQDPGRYEYISVDLPTRYSTYYIGVRAMDENNNTGEMSNIVSLSVITDTQWLVKRGATSSAQVWNRAIIFLIFPFLIHLKF